MIETLHILKKHPGQKVFELNIRTQEISVFTDFEKMGAGIIRYTPKDDHWYESAINEKSAFRKFNNKAKAIITGKTNNP